MQFALLSAVLSFFLAYVTRLLAFRFKVVDVVRGSGDRKIHTQTTPLLGGLGIGVTIILLLGFVAYLSSQGIWEPDFVLRVSGFLLAMSILLIGGSLDDAYDLPPWLQIVSPILASFVVMASGTSILEISSLAGHGIWSLDWWHGSTQLFGHTFRLIFPADALTFTWLLGVTYATKTLDGLDGLVTGQTMIGILLVILLAVSPRFFQPDVVVIAAIILGAYGGFLPWNIFPARQFLGEAGSTIAGFSLGFLAIVSGAKVATAFMALGIPLVDFVRVIIVRLRAGRSPFKGDDAHLHFQLLRLGFTQRQVAALFWMITTIFGLSALGLQTRGKAFLMIGLMSATLLVAFVARIKSPVSAQTTKKILITTGLITLIVTGWSIKGLWQAHVQDLIPLQTTIDLNQKPLTLEIADTPAKREQGLSDRPSMLLDHGMLFIFPRADRYAFWMPRMHFDLDIIWLQGSRVVDMARLPAPTPSDQEPARYTPREPADRVLELVAGQASVYGLAIGKEVSALNTVH